MAITQEQWLERFNASTHAPHITILGSYVHSNKKIKCHCSKCDKEVEIMATFLVNEFGYPCPSCKRKAIKDRMKFERIEDGYKVTNVASKRPVPFFIDECDYERVRQYMWIVDGTNHVSSCMIPWYLGKCGLHRFLLGTTKDGYEVDHIDGNPLNNRCSNLRECTQGEHQSAHARARKGLPKWEVRNG